MKTSSAWFFGPCRPCDLAPRFRMGTEQQSHCGHWHFRSRSSKPRCTKSLATRPMPAVTIRVGFFGATRIFTPPTPSTPPPSAIRSGRRRPIALRAARKSISSVRAAGEAEPAARLPRRGRSCRGSRRDGGAEEGQSAADGRSHAQALARHDEPAARATDAPSSSSAPSGTEARRHRRCSDPTLAKSVWQDYTATAERYNEPGSFTALIGYEWTSNNGGNNLHRVVVFRDGKEQDRSDPAVLLV